MKNKPKEKNYIEEEEIPITKPLMKNIAKKLYESGISKENIKIFLRDMK
jgi:hypothetical protein